MQKIFTIYFLVIMVTTVSLVLFGNSIIQSQFAQENAYLDGERIISEIADRIDNNTAVINNLTATLNENYITRARALAEIIALNPELLDSHAAMSRIARVLGVKETHVTDQNGIIRWGSVPKYYGMDFSTTAQTRPFLPALTDKKFELAQAPQPNGREGKRFQYIAVARQDKPGIVQVGIAPDVFDKALINNNIDVLIATFNVAPGENILAIDKKSGIIVADSHSQWIGKHYALAGIPSQSVSPKSHGWLIIHGQPVYTVFDEHDGYIIGACFDKSTLDVARESQNLVGLICGTTLGLSIILAIFLLLKRIIINDIKKVNEDLRSITHGDLDVLVSAKATPEFAYLSQCLNEMVASLKYQMAEIAIQAAELEESNRNILSSLEYARRIQNNMLPEPDAFKVAFSEFCVLWEPRDIVGGDIYWVKNFEKGTVLCVCDCTGHGTPGALLTMLVVTALETIVNSKNYTEPASIMWELEEKLISTLSAADNAADINDGADLAVLYIAKSGQIHLSTANTSLFICDGNGVETIKGQKISIGEGRLSSKDQIETVIIPASAENRYYVASDGLFDQIGEENGIPFGYNRLKRIVLENNALNQQEIIKKIWEEFIAYKGSEKKRDDITLVGFRTRNQ